MNITLFFLVFLPFHALAGFFDDVKEAVETIEAVTQTVKEITNSLKPGKCRYSCRRGLKKVTNKNHVPSSNGCGSFGIEVDFSHIPNLTKCCDKHDLCYDECGNPRKSCDFQFHNCLIHTCDKLKKKSQSKKSSSLITVDACQITANIVYESVTKLGCSSYLKAQKNACSCVFPTRNEL